MKMVVEYIKYYSKHPLNFQMYDLQFLYVL